MVGIGKPTAHVTFAIAIALVLPSCAKPTPVQVALKAGEPVYRCAFEYKIGWRDVKYDGFFRPDGTPVQQPKLWDYSMRNEDPLLVSMLKSHFWSLTSDPASNCTLWDSTSRFYRLHGFECEPTEFVEKEQLYSARNGRASWTLMEDGNRVMSLSWNFKRNQSLPWGEQYGPKLSVERPPDWGEANSRRFDKGGKGLIEDNYHEKGEVRAGETFYSQWSFGNAALSVPWQVWPQLHAVDKEIVITVTDEQQNKFRRWTLPKDFPRGIEAKMIEAVVKQDERERDPINNCDPTDFEMGPPIIVY